MNWVGVTHSGATCGFTIQAIISFKTQFHVFFNQVSDIRYGWNPRYEQSCNSLLIKCGDLSNGFFFATETWLFTVFILCYCLLSQPKQINHIMRKPGRMVKMHFEWFVFCFSFLGWFHETIWFVQSLSTLWKCLEKCLRQPPNLSEMHQFQNNRHQLSLAC